MEKDKRAKDETWVRYAFANDILSSEESGLDEDYIVVKPNMETGSWLLILEYYTGVSYVNTSEKGTGSGQRVRISNFLNLFADVIDGDKSTEKNINNMLDYSEQKNLGYSWYFRLYLDKLQCENFVDVRECFASLYAEYAMRDAEGNLMADLVKRLQDILTANRKFKEFMQAQKSTEGEKQFFSLRSLKTL